ncbi:hypothetical protein LTSERUB_2568 [Salmonella enterica subsp. enterica serovar Rubislaw str. A4-653]|uniref:Uncharacterized protein n=1 Tax=Salmonella enterica subsp. enterica serovar Rubislaw str. A4-653 TaxID=913081 RepID=G5QIZ7_SALRU|nr:hypothetical protein LTSERUB_2568 [Salmonella enterica subsp. enterica serovar Rubislaw str. A4-653]
MKEGKYYSLIMDRGELQKAVKSSNNNYLFSEKGAGVKPLVLIGSPVEISEFMLQNKTRSIENHIKGLPDIYIGVTKYKPKQRFTGLFPLQDILTQTVDQVSKFVPGTDITDAVGIPADLKALQQAILAMKPTLQQAILAMKAMKPKDKTSNNILYVKFSYLPEDGMVKVGSKTVSFGRILEKMQQSNRTLRR